MAPNAEIRVLAYPPAFPNRGTKTSECRIARIGSHLQFSIAHETVAKAVSLQKQINDNIEDAVTKIRRQSPDSYRLRFVNTVPFFGSYTGHTINCGDAGRPKPWVNAVKLSASAAARLAIDIQAGSWTRVITDFNDIYSASFHPTKTGQQKMESALAATLP
jgi:hypothetical protein